MRTKRLARRAAGFCGVRTIAFASQSYAQTSEGPVLSPDETNAPPVREAN